LASIRIDLTAMTNETEDQRLDRLSRDQTGKPLPKRFYKQVSIGNDNGILLDGRCVKTPMKAALILPTRALAEAVAVEWQAQEKEINPALMQLTKLSNTAIDRATAERSNVIREIVDYAGSDLVCYRADRPTALIQAQETAWNPVLDWARRRLNAHFTTAAGIIHVNQPQEALQAVERQLTGLGNYHLTAAYILTTLTGSALLALMLLDGASSPEVLWKAAHVDEDYQIAEWGEDEEAAARRANRRREFDSAVIFLTLLET
jgi:chaperone required for assembly of F1-ATPase